ncbi:MAG: hypothetical protein ACRYFU_09325 [Janthinobacterium lividum]
MPLDGSRRQGLCSSDGLTYFDPPTDTNGNARVLDLYSVATSGEVRHLLRTVPIEFTNVFNRDFFPGDAALTTLIEAQKRDTSDAAEHPREVQYFLSVSDHEGDGFKLLPLDVHFKPLKVAQFGSGEFAVLGWEEANQLMQLAVLKEDGTLWRFIDLNERSTGSGTRVAKSADATLASLTGAAFVPFGGNIMLTYPGTTKPIRVLMNPAWIAEFACVSAGIPTTRCLEFGLLLDDRRTRAGDGRVADRQERPRRAATAKDV